MAPRTRTGSLPLAGTVIKVDDVTLSKAVLVKKLEKLGARVVPRLQLNLTHVVFVKDADDAEGDAKRFDRVFGYQQERCEGLRVVSVGWVEACEKSAERVAEAGFCVEDKARGKKRQGVPPRLQLVDEEGEEGGNSKKRSRTKVVKRKGSKAMTPRSMETLEVDEDRLDSARRLKAGGFRKHTKGMKEVEEVEEEVEGGAGGGEDVDAVDVNEKKASKRSLRKGVASNFNSSGGTGELDTSLGEGVTRPASVGGDHDEMADNTKKTTKKAATAAHKKSKEKKPQPAVRFSTRCLTVYPERPVRLDKSLPEGPVEVKRILKQTVGGHAPIPEIKRVESPWGTPQMTSRLPAGVIGNLDLRTVSKAKVCDATASTRKLIKDVPSPWSVVRVYDNISVEREPSSIKSTHRRSLLGCGAVGSGIQAQTPMSSQPVRMSRAQVQSLRMSIQRHESTFHNNSQNASPNPSPLVLSGCMKKSSDPVGLSVLGPPSQAPPMFVGDAVTHHDNVEGDATGVDADGAAHVVGEEQSGPPPGLVARISTGDLERNASQTQSLKCSLDPTIYYTAPEVPITQDSSQQMTQPLDTTKASQVLRLSQEILTIPTPSQASVASDAEGDRNGVEVGGFVPPAVGSAEMAAPQPSGQPSHVSSQQTTQEITKAKSGTIAFTSVSQAALESCKAATSTLCGLTLWSNTSRKSSHITHLIIGDNRRTLKAMLAVLHGAYLLTPEYVTDSMAAGHWLDEEDYLADVVFQTGAMKAREFLDSASTSPSLLHGKKVAIYNGKRGTASTETYQVVRRICQELGGTLFHVSEADIVIVMNDEEATRPSGMKASATAVRKEWLFQTASCYELQDINMHVVGRILS